MGFTEFDVDAYQTIRPEYPAATFVEILATLGSNFSGPLQVVDLGAGTGLSAKSFLKVHQNSQLIAVDPVQSMLKQNPSTEQRLAPAHDTGLPDHSQDLILIGSALHWFEISKSLEEIIRILRPGGLIWIFEYQFPRAVQNPSLNEWIKGQFNQHWKAPNQSPRGSLKELTLPFRKHRALESIEMEARIPMLRDLSPQELTHEILSQSRVLHYLKSLTAADKQAFREKILSEVTTFYDPADRSKTLSFDYYLNRYGFKKIENK